MWETKCNVESEMRWLTKRYEVISSACETPTENHTIWRKEAYSDSLKIITAARRKWVRWTKWNERIKGDEYPEPLQEPDNESVYDTTGFTEEINGWKVASLEWNWAENYKKSSSSYDTSWMAKFFRQSSLSYWNKVSKTMIIQVKARIWRSTQKSIQWDRNESLRQAEWWEYCGSRPVD
jgi:hypothetical protein